MTVFWNVALCSLVGIDPSLCQHDLQSHHQDAVQAHQVCGPPHHGAASQKTVIFSLTAVRTGNHA
jgi:hypothetical protein